MICFFSVAAVREWNTRPLYVTLPRLSYLFLPRDAMHTAAYAAICISVDTTHQCYGQAVLACGVTPNLDFKVMILFDV